MFELLVQRDRHMQEGEVDDDDGDASSGWPWILVLRVCVYSTRDGFCHREREERDVRSGQVIPEN